MNKIVLISPYCSDYIGIQSMYWHILNKGYDVYLIYFQRYETKYPPSDKDYETLINTIQDINPSIIGMSMASYAVDVAFKISDMVKSKSNALIVLGGVHPMISPDECIKYADVVCIGEGEESISKLCEKYFKGEDYTDIPNLWVKQKGRIIKNPIKIIEKLDDLSLPNFDSKNFIHINNGSFSKGDFKLFDNNGYLIMTSRGCPCRCTYCVHSVLSRKIDSTPYKGKYVRRRSVKHVIDELRLAKEHFPMIKLIRVCDDIFSIDAKWLREFSVLYKKHINIPLWCNMHINFINQEIIDSLKHAGLVLCSIGVESGSQRIRYQVYNKFISNDKIFEVVNLLNKNKVKHNLNILMNNPLEGDEDLKKGVEFLLTLPRPIHMNFFSLVNFPGTDLTERLLKEGIIERKDICKNVSNSVSMRVLGKQKLKEIKKQYWFYIYNSIPKSFIPKFLIRFFIKDFFIVHPKFVINTYKVIYGIYNLKDRLYKSGNLYDS